MTTLHAHFDGRALIPVGPVDLPTDRLLEIDVHEVTEPRPGSPAAVLRAMREPPHLTDEAVEEFERAIESGKMPVRYNGVYDDLRE
jgi:hypothetical protein